MNDHKYVPWVAILLGTLGLTFGIAGMVGIRDPQVEVEPTTLSLEELIIVDTEGTPRITLTTYQVDGQPQPGIALTDDQGRQRLSISINSQGDGAIIEFFDADMNRQLRVNTLDNPHTPQGRARGAGLFLYDTNGQSEAALGGFSNSGSLSIHSMDETGRHISFNWPEETR